MKKVKELFIQGVLSSLLVIFISLCTNTAIACTTAQLIDYDYQAKETLGNGYATFGRLWSLDGQEVCSEPLKYSACFTLTPKGKGAELQVRMIKDEQAQTTYSQQLKYNSNEVIRFDFEGVDVYLKLYISNTVADMKMSGKGCQAGFPKLPRQVTRAELDNMYQG